MSARTFWRLYLLALVCGLLMPWACSTASAAELPLSPRVAQVGDECLLPVPMAPRGTMNGEFRPVRVKVRAMIRDTAERWPAAWVAYADPLGAEMWQRALLVDLVECRP